MKTFISHIGYIGEMKKNFHILRFLYLALVTAKKKFIAAMQNSQIGKPEPLPPSIQPVPVPPSPKPTPYSVGSYINKRIRSFQLFGKTYHPHTWKELIVLVSEEMYNRQLAEFSRCLSLRGSRMSYFSQQPNEMSQPVQIAGSTFFVETKLNSNSIVKRSRELMGLFGYKGEDLQVSAE